MTYQQVELVTEAAALCNRLCNALGEATEANTPRVIHALRRSTVRLQRRGPPTLSAAIAVALTGTPDPRCADCGGLAFASVSGRLLCRNCY